MKNRRASRAWRLSPHGVASVDAEQHRAQRAGRQKTWAADAEPSGGEFFNLFCSSCHYFLSEKGLMMQMLAKPESICFATDQRPQGVDLQDDAEKMPGMCDCKVQDSACGCGARLGYHLTSACEVCEATPQRWFLCPRCVEAEPRGIWEEPKALPQFGAESKPMPLSELNGREKGKSELERREKAVCEKEEQLRQRELRVQRQEEPKDVQKKALQQLAAVSSQAQEAEGRVQEAAEQVELAAQGRLEFSQRLAEKRKELEKWQQALEEKSRALEQLERSLTPSWGFPNMGHMHLDAVNIASVAGKAMVGFTFAASKVVIAMARPVVGAVRIASSAAVQFGLSSYAAAVAKANEEAQERAIAEAVHLRRMKYMASPGTMTSGSMSGMAYPDGTGVPPRTWQRPAWSPGWQASPIYPASPAPLPPVMEREGILGWIRRNSGCGTRSHHRAGYPIRYPTSR